MIRLRPYGKGTWRVYRPYHDKPDRLLGTVVRVTKTHKPTTYQALGLRQELLGIRYTLKSAADLFEKRTVVSR